MRRREYVCVCVRVCLRLCVCVCVCATTLSPASPSRGPCFARKSRIVPRRGRDQHLSLVFASLSLPVLVRVVLLCCAALALGLGRRAVGSSGRAGFGVGRCFPLFSLVRVLSRLLARSYSAVPSVRLFFRLPCFSFVRSCVFVSFRGVASGGLWFFVGCCGLGWVVRVLISSLLLACLAASC